MRILFVLLIGACLTARAAVSPPTRASQTEVNAGLNNSKFVTPLTLQNKPGGGSATNVVLRAGTGVNVGTNGTGDWTVSIGGQVVTNTVSDSRAISEASSWDVTRVVLTAAGWPESVAYEGVVIERPWGVELLYGVWTNGLSSPNRGYMAAAIGTSLDNLTKIGPIVEPTSGAWDSNYCIPGRLYVESGTNYMTYFGGGGTGFEADETKIGMMWSTNSTLTTTNVWHKYSGNPVLTVGAPGQWDDAKAFVSCIVKAGPGDYRLFYNASGTPGCERIGWAYGPTPFGPWTKYAGNPVVSDRGGIAGSIAADPNVFKVRDGLWRMVYRALNGSWSAPYTAWSTDLTNWFGSSNALNVISYMPGYIFASGAEAGNTQLYGGGTFEDNGLGMLMDDLTHIYLLRPSSSSATRAAFHMNTNLGFMYSSSLASSNSHDRNYRGTNLFGLPSPVLQQAAGFQYSENTNTIIVNGAGTAAINQNYDWDGANTRYNGAANSFYRIVNNSGMWTIQTAVATKHYTNNLLTGVGWVLAASGVAPVPNSYALPVSLVPMNLVQNFTGNGGGLTNVASTNLVGAFVDSGTNGANTQPAVKANGLVGGSVPGITIATNGNVGIGIAQASFKLYVRSTTANNIATYSLMSAASGTSGWAGQFENTTASGTSYGIGGYASGAAVVNVAGYFSATGAANNYGLIVENGSVGIGTTAPVGKLDVNGALNATSVNVTNSPTFRTTNAAPTAVTVGTTVPDTWILFTNASGQTYKLPAWAEH